MWQQLFDGDVKCIFSISPLKAWHLLFKTSISVICFNTSKYLTPEINKGETHNTGVCVVISSFECTTWPIRNDLNILKLTFPFTILSSLLMISSFFHLVLLSVQSDSTNEIEFFFLFLFFYLNDWLWPGILNLAELLL